MEQGTGKIDAILRGLLDANGQESSYFIQVGAGAGDRDSRANFRDGFTEYVKGAPLTSQSKIILVEPNPLNIDALKQCWSLYPNAEIHQIGIVPRELSNSDLLLFYSDLDAPCYQVASLDPRHVLLHYPMLSANDLKVHSIMTDTLESFIETTTSGGKIIMLALDIEGIDSQILLSTDFTSINVCLLSFEHIHLGQKGSEVIKHLNDCGFTYIGEGVDHRGHDVLYGNSKNMNI